MNTLIYYFTGTGNCRIVAQDIAANLEEAKIIRISRDLLAGELAADSLTVGIVTPVYFSGIPALVKEFIESLTVSKNTYIFAVAVYGESKGIALNQVKNLLTRKGLELAGAFGVQMPHNIHITSPEKQAEYFQSEKGKAALIANSIKNKAMISDQSNIIANVFIGMNYKLMQRAGNFDRKFAAADNCIGCATCEKVCPANNIVMKDGKPEWLQENKCQFCVACLQWCPKQAIRYGKTQMAEYSHPDVKANDLFRRI